MSTPRNPVQPKKDQVWYCRMDRITVLRVSKKGEWADILVEQFNTRARWTKRQPVPFPADWDAPADLTPAVRVEAGPVTFDAEDGGFAVTV